MKFSPTNFHAVFWDLTDVAPDDLHSLQQLDTSEPPTGFSDAYAINVPISNCRHFRAQLHTVK